MTWCDIGSKAILWKSVIFSDIECTGTFLFPVTAHIIIHIDKILEPLLGNVKCDRRCIAEPSQTYSWKVRMWSRSGSLKAKKTELIPSSLFNLWRLRRGLGPYPYVVDISAWRTLFSLSCCAQLGYAILCPLICSSTFFLTSLVNNNKILIWKINLRKLLVLLRTPSTHSTKKYLVWNQVIGVIVWKMEQEI